MSTTYVHPRARLGKPAAKAVRRNAPSTSGNGIPDPFDTGKDNHRLVSDVMTGQDNPMFPGGHDSGDITSEEGTYLQDLGDGTPDQELNRWAADIPNPPSARHLRRSQSLISLDKADKVADPRMERHPDPRNDTPAVDLVAVAEDLPTAVRKDKIERRCVRTVKPDVVRLPSTPSEGERPSKSRVDSSWGDADLEKEELDLEAQQAALDSLKRNFHKRKAEKNGHNKKLVRLEPVVARNAHRDQVTQIVRNMNSQPIRQITPDSYIGQTLKNIHRFGITKRKSGNNPFSSSSSSSSDSSESSDESELD